MAILELLKRGNLTVSDVLKLYNYYYNSFLRLTKRNKNNNEEKEKEKQEEDNVGYHLLMVQMLQSDKMISYLVNILFTHSETLCFNGNETPAYKQSLSRYCFLFCYAMAVTFEKKAVTEDIDMSGITGVSMNPQNNNDTLIIETTKESTLNALINKMKKICFICNDKDFGNQLCEEKAKQDLLFDSIVPCSNNSNSDSDGDGDNDGSNDDDEEDFSSLIAYGLFHWINYCIITKTTKYFELTSQPYITPLFLSLLSQIAYHHNFLRGDIVQLSVSIITKPKNLEGNAELNFQESFLELIMFIMQLGNYVIVFNSLNESFLNKLDRKMCRILIHHIIDTIKAPLPIDFVHLLFNMLSNSNMIQAIKSDKTSVQKVKDYIRTIDQSKLPGNSRSILQQMTDSINRHSPY